jgi:hypothetical protein
MTPCNPDRSRGIQAVLIWFVALAFAVTVARAQQPQARLPQPVYRTYQRPPTMRSLARPVTRPLTQPTVARPMPTRPRIYPRSTPARQPTPRAPELFALHPFAPYTSALPALAAPDFRAGFQPRGAWIGARGYFNSFLFGGWPLSAYWNWQASPNEQMLPLGFGMWPACDSASIPGRFWSAGPCFGVEDYQSLATNYQNQQVAEGAPQYYRPSLEFIIQPEEAPSSTTAKPSQPENKPNMVVCLTNGNQTEVSDWWVTNGRFYFIPINGPSNGTVNPSNAKTQTVDLDALDLQKTIEENEKRGRTFILNFTPPDERPTSPPLPSNR